MKFYFCEKCGKRLTEAEIAGGQARDKKLRGVFCNGCAEGVMTLETMPLTEELAREITGAAPGEPDETADVMPAASPQPPASHRLRRGSARQPPSGSPTPGRATSHDQMLRIVDKLTAINPGLPKDGFRPYLEGGKVVGLKFPSQHLNDMTALRALPHLRSLDCYVVMSHEGKLDLTPVKDMPSLTKLHVYNSRCSDLTPLKGSNIETLNIAACRIADYAPLGDMPKLKHLTCDMKPSPANGVIVRKMKSIERINKMSRDEFLKASE